MAWIELDLAVLQSAELLTISDQLELRPYAVLGALSIVWGYVDEHGRLDEDDAIVEQMTAARLKLILPADISGVTDAMIHVGWLAEDDGEVLRFPNFKRHAPKGCKRDRKAWGKRLRGKTTSQKTNGSTDRAADSPTDCATASHADCSTDSAADSRTARATPTDRPTDLNPPISPLGGEMSLRDREKAARTVIQKALKRFDWMHETEELYQSLEPGMRAIVRKVGLKKIVEDRRGWKTELKEAIQMWVAAN